MEQNTKKIHAGVIENCYEIEPGSEIFYMRIRSARKIDIQPGQFIVLHPAFSDCEMPRPFSVVLASQEKIAIIFRVVGRNTRAYSEMKEGCPIKFYGPYGKEVSFIPERPVVLVGGGIGSAALCFPFHKTLGEDLDTTIYLGAKTEVQLAAVRQSFEDLFGSYCKIRLISDDQGLVTDLLEEFLKEDGGHSQIVACGPGHMLFAVAKLCKKYGNPGQVLMEEIMACGMGACKGCAIFGGEAGKEVLHVCHDGPAFDVRWIDWEKFMQSRLTPIVFEGGDIHLGRAAEVDMTCQLGPLVLEYPFLCCSGTMDVDALEDGSFDLRGIGAFVSKGLSLYLKPGNRMPRVCETPSGILNSIGLEYIGAACFIDKIMPRLRKLGIPIIVNINGTSIEEYCELTRILNEVDGIAALEVNISCPNVKKGGMAFGVDPRMAARVTGAVKRISNFPIITKLSPNVSDITIIARAVEDAGADMISLINTLVGMDIDVRTRRPKLGNVIGGLSGPAVGPVALRMVWEVAKTVQIPIIGMGGNRNGETAAKFMMAGASASAFGTSGFSNREIFPQALEELRQIIFDQGFQGSSQLVGSMVY